MDPIIQPLDPALAARHEKTKREMERRKLDRCKVHNPLDEAFTVVYNGYANTVPPHTDAVFFRYIAEPFLTKLVDKMIYDKAEAEVKHVNEQRADRGQEKVKRMEKNEIYANPDYSINNLEVRRPLVKMIWKGIVEEYGMNNLIVQQQPKQVDMRPLDEQLMEEIDKENLVAEEETEPVTLEPDVTPEGKVEEPAPAMENLPAA